MQALILFSHGSLLCGGAYMVHSHAAIIAAKEDYCAVEVGFINYNHPSFTEAIDRCKMRGASQIVVIPYLLSPGKFYSRDFSLQMTDARRVNPDVEFIVGEPIGYDKSMAEMILMLTQQGMPEEKWRDNVTHSLQSCKGSPVCPLYGTIGCPILG